MTQHKFLVVIYFLAYSVFSVQELEPAASHKERCHRFHFTLMYTHAGAVVPLLVLVLSWRLAVLVPVVQTEEQRSERGGFAMEVPPSMYEGSSNARDFTTMSGREVLYWALPVSSRFRWHNTSYFPCFYMTITDTYTHVPYISNWCTLWLYPAVMNLLNPTWDVATQKLL